MLQMGLISDKVPVKAMHSRLGHVGLILVLLTSLLLTIGNQAAAISKLAVPELDEQELPFYLDKSAHHDPHLYLFNSLALISRRRAAAVFELLGGPTSGITPLLRLEIHPPVDVPFQTKFFDVTIWGQLSNFFQKNIELLAIEREIRALFQELEELNARYLQQLGSQAVRPLMLVRHNYLQHIPGAEVKQETRSGATPTILTLLQQHERARQSDRLASQLAARAGAGRGPALEAKAPAAASMRATEAQQDAESIGTIPGGRLVYLFRLFRLVIRYLLQNEIETMIYLWILILLSIVVKSALQRL